jgi:hypothetical protein
LALLALAVLAGLLWTLLSHTRLISDLRHRHRPDLLRDGWREMGAGLRPQERVS